jgi:hypothetical protein
MFTHVLHTYIVFLLKIISYVRLDLNIGMLLLLWPLHESLVIYLCWAWALPRVPCIGFFGPWNCAQELTVSDCGTSATSFVVGGVHTKVGVF